VLSARDPAPAGLHPCLRGECLQAVYGNWVNGKRRGVVGGVDYVYTGRVRSLNTESIRSQLHSGNIVLLTSLAYSLAGEALSTFMCLLNVLRRQCVTMHQLQQIWRQGLISCLCSDSGEVLNCNVYDIATHAAVELAADKFIVITADDLQVRIGRHVLYCM
jgi:acetylglutamate kinase